MKEILTIQCGASANYVGTHFWNLLDAQCPPPPPPPQDRFVKPPRRYALQDSADDASVMFRSSTGTHGASSNWHPRLVCVDSKAGFGAMTAQGFVAPESGATSDD